MTQLTNHRIDNLICGESREEVRGARAYRTCTVRLAHRDRAVGRKLLLRAAQAQFQGAAWSRWDRFCHRFSTGNGAEVTALLAGPVEVRWLVHDFSPR